MLINKDFCQHCVADHIDLEQGCNKEQLDSFFRKFFHYYIGKNDGSFQSEDISHQPCYCRLFDEKERESALRFPEKKELLQRIQFSEF